MRKMWPVHMNSTLFCCSIFSLPYKGQKNAINSSKSLSWYCSTAMRKSDWKANCLFLFIQQKRTDKKSFLSAILRSNCSRFRSELGHFGLDGCSGSAIRTPHCWIACVAYLVKHVASRVSRNLNSEVFPELMQYESVPLNPDKYIKPSKSPLNWANFKLSVQNNTAGIEILRTLRIKTKFDLSTFRKIRTPPAAVF